MNVPRLLRTALWLTPGLLALPVPVAADPPATDPPAAMEDAFGLELPDLGRPAPRPWSDKPVLNDPASFQFAVVTDRTGGHRPGVWMHGVRNLNMLRPEFVVSVGDLIEGYTTDLKVLDEQWNEFLGFIDRLDMRFFFVAGNHDVTNPLMHRVWKQRFGLEWYSFNYKDVHFVCLSSEDPQARLGEQQLAWLEEDLRRHADARWTFFFMHKPLWAYADRDLAAGNPDSSQWSLVDEWLGDRPYTAFAGHHHRYVQYDRRGRKVYQLATTGGGSQLRGVDYGEFDHITWVTMEDGGPRVANIKLDGVLPADVVTEEKASRFRDFLAKARLEVEPVLVSGAEEITAGEIQVQLHNEFDDPIEVQVEIAGLPLSGLSVDPARLRLQATPHGEAVAVSRFRLNPPAPLAKFQQVALTASIRSTGDAPLTAELTLPVLVDRRYSLPLTAVRVDGQLDEWTTEPLEFPRANPPLKGAAEEWQGPEDASMSFRLARSTERLFLAGEVQDDRITDRDSVTFILDTRPFDLRQADERLRNPLRIVLTPGVAGGPTVRISGEGAASQVEAEVATSAASGGYRFEIAVPWSAVLPRPTGDLVNFQAMALLADSDQPQDLGCQLLWRNAPDPQRRNTRFGCFFAD